jgi:hypothetical protein
MTGHRANRAKGKSVGEKIRLNVPTGSHGVFNGIKCGNEFSKRSKTMDPSQIHQTLTQLHTELEQMQALDDESRQLLEHLQNDIQAVLKEPSPTTRKSLGDRLGAAVVHFEDSHPDLTLTLKQVMDNLAQI